MQNAILRGMKIYLATGNLNKKREMSEILSSHTVVVPKDEGIDFDPEETGTTFYANSLIKAEALWNVVHCPVIADDSGICVDALGGAPGIYSSRYAGPEFMQGRPDGKKISQEEQNIMLVEQTNRALALGVDLEAGKKKGLFPNGERSARYVCAMVLYLGPSRLYVAQETFEGTIISSMDEARGNGGFGYDPLFVVPGTGKTAAQLTPDEKNAISHRGKAGRIIQRIVESIL